MEMRLRAGGFGVGVGSLGFSAGKVAHLSFRNSKDEGHWYMGVYEDFDFGSEGPHSIVASISTDWIPVNASVYPWFRKKAYLVGKKAVVKVSGTALYIGKGTALIDIAIIDEYHQAIHKAEFHEVPIQATNFSVGTIDVSGTIQRYDRRTERLIEKGLMEPGSEHWKHMKNQEQTPDEIPET